MDSFVVSILEETLAEFSESERKEITHNSAMIAVGGSGRGEVCPYSDADIVFLFRSQITDQFSRFSKRLVPELWDAGIKLGQRVLTVQSALQNARSDPHMASSLVHSRLLWGDEKLAATLAGRFQQRIVKRHTRRFIRHCIGGREEERTQLGGGSQQLEPDIKQSLGGLRDIHLILWLAFAHYGVNSIESLRQKGVFTHDDARRLKNASEFLTRIRIEMHLHAGRAQDILTRDEQLRLAEVRGFERTDAIRPVERFMQDYFQHSMAIAEITQRFVARHRPRSLGEIVGRYLSTHRVNRHFLLSPHDLDVSPAHLDSVLHNLDDIVRVYQSSALYRVRLSPRLIDAIKEKARLLPAVPSPEASKAFMQILRTTGRIAKTIRSMHETNVLELIIPEWKRVRCLLQFNQYHHYTVDEHTLRCIEVCEGFATEDSPAGAAFRRLKGRELLFLALLLHDAGKGFAEHHSQVGFRMAKDVCHRLMLDEDQTEIVQFLVLHHLEMADLAFRHDTSDPRVQMQFSHKVGTPEKLRLLFVLTIADVSGVGPDVWNNWKADLLTDFFGRLMRILSGQPPGFHEEQRLAEVRTHVYESIRLLEPDEEPEELHRWVDAQLDAFSTHYLSQTSPARIADDLEILRKLEPGEVQIEAGYDKDNETVDYRIITDAEHSSGCFHLITGALTANRLEILRAEITTTNDGVVVDVFHVRDDDFEGEVPEFRMNEVRDAISSVLRGETRVEDLLGRNRRFKPESQQEPVMELPSRVSIDNDTSDRCTVLSVFAHDHPGLLYTISKTIYKLGLSIELAKIGTHFDQVVDVFYVTDNDGRKIASDAHRRAIRERLLEELAASEAATHGEFASS